MSETITHWARTWTDAIQARPRPADLPDRMLDAAQEGLQLDSRSWGVLSQAFSAAQLEPARFPTLQPLLSATPPQLRERAHSVHRARGPCRRALPHGSQALCGSQALLLRLSGAASAALRR